LGVETQVTQYVYGTEANQASPAVPRFDILSAELYPDSDDTYNPVGADGAKLGNGTDATYDRIEYTYDYASRLSTKKMQSTTTHTYTYDTLGRFFTDQATTLGTGVDGAIRRIEYAYDDLSRALTTSSYSAVSGGTLLNQVKYTYDVWGNEQKCEQGHEGTATGAPSYQKTFADGAVGTEAKYVRVSQVTYPNARGVFWNYPADTAVGGKLSRVDNVANDASGTLKFAQYTYLETGSSVKVAHPGVTGGLNLDLGIDTGNPAGWDDLGRIKDQKWQNDSSVVKDQYQYGYDRTSNRTFRDNLTATGKDHFYVYSGLDQSTTAKQGDLNAGRTDITGTPAFQEDWTLESLGNWRGLVQTTSGTTTLNQTRSHTKANETTTIGATVGTDWGDGVLDADGRMTRVPQPASPNLLWQLTYDAWGRLVKVVNNTGGAEIAEYKYDGRHRRTVKLKPHGNKWDRRDYYYSCEWQVVEERERINVTGKTTVATTPILQWVWGTRYVDEVILRDVVPINTAQRLYYCQDANWNVTALVDNTGAVVEHVLYDAYGKHTLYNGTWSATQASTLFNNEVLFGGYRYSPESGLYQIRNREYHPTLGRWLQRDLMGFHDGMNLYAYVSSRPLNMTDPTGLAESCCSKAPTDGKADGYAEKSLLKGPGSMYEEPEMEIGETTTWLHGGAPSGAGALPPRGTRTTPGRTSLTTATGGGRLTSGASGLAYLANLAVEMFERDHDAKKNLIEEAKNDAMKTAEKDCSNICDDLDCHTWAQNCRGKVTVLSWDEGQPLKAAQPGASVSSGTGESSDKMGWTISARVILYYRCTCLCKYGFWGTIFVAPTERCPTGDGFLP
jgi:RHS repeat-associated protein